MFAQNSPIQYIRSFFPTLNFTAFTFDHRLLRQVPTVQLSYILAQGIVSAAVPLLCAVFSICTLGFLCVKAMAGHDDSSVSGKKSSENEVPTFNAENMQSNMKVVYYSRTFMSIIGGVIAGILGFTGLMGFVIYLFVMAITSVCLTAKAGFSIHSYFDTWNRVLLDGFFGGLLSFVLFWTYPFITLHKNLLMISCISSKESHLFCDDTKRRGVERKPGGRFEGF
ncbi:hypothetical protein L1887_28360 [Cichorium endivia]|nr:hypothetical protein L1887_28360 [Cichorium endivia]